MKVTLWKLEKIRPHRRNPRQISAHAVAKVAASVREFGWRQLIVVDQEAVIICGHTRLLAAAIKDRGTGNGMARVTTPERAVGK